MAEPDAAPAPDAAGDPTPPEPRSLPAKLLRSRALPWRLARMLLLFILIFLPTMMLLENAAIYHPMPYPEGENWEVTKYRVRDGETGYRVDDVWLTSSDGVKLHAWYFQPVIGRDGQMEPLEPTGAMLWCHGNAGNITHRYWLIDPFKATGVAVLLPDYRGYGRSEGSPSEDGLNRDVRAAWDHLVQDRGFRNDQIVITGISLGGAPATHLATQVDPAGLALESTFTSIPAMARRLMPIMPSVLIRHRMDTVNRIGSLDCPVQIMHGRLDRTIPFDMGQALHDAARPDRARFIPIDGADHDDLQYTAGAAYMAAYRRFFADCGLNISVEEDADSPFAP